jgi:hypothetical protein
MRFRLPQNEIRDSVLTLAVQYIRSTAMLLMVRLVLIISNHIIGSGEIKLLLLFPRPYPIGLCPHYLAPSSGWQSRKLDY